MSEPKSMVERVAKAMFEASSARSNHPDMWFPNAYDTRMARAAIAEMREPTETMRAAGYCGPIVSWRAMIDAALEGK